MREKLCVVHSQTRNHSNDAQMNPVLHKEKLDHWDPEVTRLVLDKVKNEPKPVQEAAQKWLNKNLPQLVRHAQVDTYLHGFTAWMEHQKEQRARKTPAKADGKTETTWAHASANLAFKARLIDELERVEKVYAKKHAKLKKLSNALSRFRIDRRKSVLTKMGVEWPGARPVKEFVDENVTLNQLDTDDELDELA